MRNLGSLFGITRSVYREKMDILSFRITFYEQYESIEKVAGLLKSNRVFLSPDKNCLELRDLLEKIEICCQVYSNDLEPYWDTVEIWGIEFRTSIEKISQRMIKMNFIVNPELSIPFDCL